MSDLPSFPLAVTGLSALGASEQILDRFLSYVSSKGIELYPAQEEAILELYEGKNVILNTPTGSGKSLVAAALHFYSLAKGRRSIYTCPIKALVNEKFLSLCRDFGPEMVGMATGDATVNRDAPILCCTAEILANMALRQGEDAPANDIIIDEFHYYSDRDRGVAWQVPLLTLSKSRFLLMSATLGEVQFFEKVLTDLTRRKTEIIRSVQRPVPLEFSYSEEPLDSTVDELLKAQRAPIYVVHFTQLECSESAQHFMSLNFCTREEKQAIGEALAKVNFKSPYGKELKKYLSHGVGLHHAGLLPRYRVLVEQLAQKGWLKIICGTDTLGVGVNVPIRTVLLTRLSKYDGEKMGLLTSRDFHQICGRAGRKGFDDRGWVVAQAPDHVIENLRLERKAGDDPKKKKKIVRKKAPEGFVGWSRETFEKLVQSVPEPLVSRFQVSHAVVLNVLARPKQGCRAMKHLIQRSHESAKKKLEHRSLAMQLLRSLLSRKIVEWIPLKERTEGRALRVNVELQDDFSLNQTLSLYLLDTVKLLDPQHPEYALDLLSLVESILENPDIVLRKQLDKLKSQKMAEMKAEGVEFQDRLDQLDQMEYPKPRREFIYSTFNEFAAEHPWVGQENIRPKSIAREMFEGFMSFDDYVKRYQLSKVEGVLLRYLSETYKTLSQTVPDTFKTEPVLELEAFLGALVRQVDSSLLEEWEKIRNPEYQPPEETVSREAPGSVGGGKSRKMDITRDEGGLVRMVRSQVFMFLKALSQRDFESALVTLEGMSEGEEAEGWSVADLSKVWDEFLEGHHRLRLDPEARNTRHTVVSKKPELQVWKVWQNLVDEAGQNDWGLEWEVHLPACRDQERLIMKLVSLRAAG